MWKSLVRSSIIGGIVVFLWYMLSWTGLHLHQASLNAFTDSSEVAKAITKYAPVDGIYTIPSLKNNDPIPDKSPFIFVNVRRGIDLKNMTSPMIMGLISYMLGAFVISYMLTRSKATRYWHRVGFVTLFGVIIAVLGVFPSSNWWHFPLNWCLMESLDAIVAWFLGGLVIAKLIKH